MVQSTYANSIVNIMLGWLKALANWVLKLFNLGTSMGTSPLSWLSDNWLKLLILLIIIGMGADLLVWLIRWRPYWVWLRKKRIVIEDDNFFAGERMSGYGGRKAGLFDEEEEERMPKKRRAPAVQSEEPDEEFVVPSSIERGLNSPNQANPRRKRSPSRKSAGKAGSPSSSAEKRPAKLLGKLLTKEAPDSTARKKRPRPAGADDLFDPTLGDADASLLWEDEVFNISDLPIMDDEPDTHDYDL